MDFLIERSISKSIQVLLGKEVWATLSKSRRMAIIELIEQYSFELLKSSHNSGIDLKEIEASAKKKLEIIDQQELLALLHHDIFEFPDIGIEDYKIDKKIFNRLLKRMEALLQGLRKLSFKHPEMEKHRVQIIDALEKRESMPSDPYDLWIINKVIPGIQDEEETKKIDNWLKEEENDNTNK